MTRQQALELVNQARLDAAEAERDRAVEALRCPHNHRTDEFERDPWEYVEHEAKTWNRCRLCGLLELWEGGMFVDVAVLAEQEKEQP